MGCSARKREWNIVRELEQATQSPEAWELDELIAGQSHRCEVALSFDEQCFPVVTGFNQSKVLCRSERGVRYRLVLLRSIVDCVGGCFCLENEQQFVVRGHPF